jgi:A/G-specific adenine glycosylase
MTSSSRGRGEKGEGRRENPLQDDCSSLLPPASSLGNALLSWYDQEARSLPWRKPPGTPCAEPVEAYHVLLSEFMLQQTTVTAVIPRFDQWLTRYPTIQELARSGEEDVVRSWEGLGYYSRARNLHAAAREIVSQYGGKIPTEPRQLKKLPGIGEYTAGAIASIAYGVRAAALDANNLRVWSRLLASSDRKRINSVFGRILPTGRPGDFNQALMDLGATVCTPKDPACNQCPLSSWCRARQRQQIEDFPAKKKRPVTTRIEAALGIIIKDNQILVQKRPEGGLFGGMWEFPGGKIRDSVNPNVGKSEKTQKDHKTRLSMDRKNKESLISRSSGLKPNGLTESRNHGTTAHPELPEEAVIREVREETGLRVQVCGKLGVFTHTYTRFRVRLHVFICKGQAGRLHNPSARWVTLEELETLPMPSANRRIVRKLEEWLEADS